MRPFLVSLAALAVTAPAAFGATKELLDDQGASTGWRVTWADAYDVDITFAGRNGDQVLFTKTATFGAGQLVPEGIEVVFERTDNSNTTLVLRNEVVTNNTGIDWNGFEMILASGAVGGTPNFAFATSDGSPGLGDFDIDPFTQFAFADNSTRLSLSGGIVANNSTWTPGSSGNTGLAIVAGTDIRDSFAFKEIAIPIPTPAAASAGIATLAAIGGIGAMRRRRA